METTDIDKLPTDKKKTRPRPALFLALGRSEPPDEVEVDGKTYTIARTFKHDSWAATALYEHPTGSIVVKFNRRQSIFGFPMKWLGRILAQREGKMLQRLATIEQVPEAWLDVKVDGKPISTACAHVFIPGQSLMSVGKVDDEFFARLITLLDQVHQHNIAYIDMHKQDNILVDESGTPHLIDFQISLFLPRIWPLSILLNVLQRCDRYHLDKHKHFFRPDLYPESIDRPGWIKAHRMIAIPLRQFRRKMLVRMGIRKSCGYAASEHAPQEELRDNAVIAR